MTEELQEKGSNETVLDATARYPDWMLQDLVEMANLGVGFPVTLTVGGMLVTGNVVSGHAYVKAMHEEVIGKGVADEKVRDALAKRFAPYLELYPEVPREDRKPPTFIHLSGARFLIPGNQPQPAGGVMWRGVISDICGFSFGTLS